MRKRLIVTGLGISLLAMITHIFASDWSSLIRVNLYPATIYVDGEKVDWERSGHDFNGTSHVPTAMEYQGTIYVPLPLVGQLVKKPVGWEESNYSLWIGERPDGTQKESRPQKTAGNDVAPATGLATIPAIKKPIPDRIEGQKHSAPSLFGLALGDSEKQVLSVLGSPARREPSALGYEWLIYNHDPNRYLQVGVVNGKVVDLYSNAPHARVGNAGIGTSYQSLSRQYEIASPVVFTYGGVKVELTNQPKERLLVLQGNSAVIFYIDKLNQDKVTAMRLIDKLVLIQGSYYETKLTYKGTGPNVPFDPPTLTPAQQRAVDAAQERQILDLANVIRHRYQLPLLAWSDPTARVAKNHSQDMKNGSFFDHVSATTKLDPFQRLEQAGIRYKLAGENIAAGFVDAIEAHESWMNSSGHRKNILEKEFTHLGAGVASEYYTQNFITPAQ